LGGIFLSSSFDCRELISGDELKVETDKGRAGQKPIAQGEQRPPVSDCGFSFAGRRVSSYCRRGFHFALVTHHGCGPRADEFCLPSEKLRRRRFLEE